MKKIILITYITLRAIALLFFGLYFLNQFSKPEITHEKMVYDFVSNRDRFEIVKDFMLSQEFDYSFTEQNFNDKVIGEKEKE